ncbi:MAG TPA: Sec-independent protein translocase subunit TatA [Kineosporiaceae bacterium]
MFRALEPWHLIVLVVVIALLFGSKRLPDAARGLGRSMRIFKAEVKEMREDDVRRQSGSTAPRPSEPLEGRIVDGDGTRSGAPSEQRTDL